ncbi:hypothetical protein ACMFMG_009447 [Clarireedia jacksonii]
MADRNQQSPRQGVHLSQVYPKNDETETDVDIIAIHGLDTKSPDTWIWRSSNPNRNINWLQDQEMLPTAFPKARIFTINWPASLFKERSTIEMKITELARSLLLSIQSRPGADDSRPVLFIASCLGGIVLIQAIVIAARSEKEYNSLSRAIGGIVFLATPFRGTAFQDIAEAAVTFLKSYARLGGKQVTELLDSVKASTCFLEDLVGEFTQTCQQRDQPYELAIFYENKKGNLLRKLPLPSRFADILSKPKLLVDSSSARLDIVTNPIPLARRHNQMNKFYGPDDPGYIAVTDRVRITLRAIYENRLIDKADAWICNEHYTADMLKIDRLSGEQLSMDQCYINLAITERPDRDVAYSKGSKIDSFSLLARLKIKTPDKDIQVELKTLFDPRKGPNGHTIQPRRIFIRGRAGVGKTTLCKKIVHDFKTHKNSKDRKDPMWNDLFDRVLWVPLRNLKRKPDKGYNLEGLFLRDFFLKTPTREHLAKELERELDVTKSGRTLFVLDGLDEVSEGLDKDNDMHQFLKFLLEQPNVIITSRPLARFSYNLHPDLELETIGFYPDQVNTYIDKAFTDPATAKIDPKAGQIRSFLQDHWLIQGLVRIPIQLDALCYTWKKSSLSEAAPETMTAMYQAIEHRLWKKDILRLEKVYDGKLLTQSFIQEASRVKIEGFVKDEISFLEYLAFSGLHNDTIDFVTEHRNAIADHFVPGLLLDQTLPCLSFLRRSNPSAEDYHFLHLTYQEYFAARYFIRQWTSRQDLKWLELKTQETRRGRPVYNQDNAVSYLQKHKYNARYNVFWRFVAGLLDAVEGNETLHFFQRIEDEPRDLLGPVHQRLVMYCLSEIAPSQQTPEFSRLQEHLKGQLKQWLLFECNFDFNKAGYSHLAAEMEFPEKFLEDILQKESEDIKWKILNSLVGRPRLSQAIIRLVASYLGNDVSIRLKTAALGMFQRHYLALSEEVVQAIAALLKDPDKDIRSAAAKTLGMGSALPEGVVQAIAALLKDPDKHIMLAAIKALRNQLTISKEIAQAIAVLLKDPDNDIRSAAAWSLRSLSALPEEIIQTIAALLKDPDRDVRSAAAWALSTQSVLPEIIQTIAALLKDPDGYIRRAASLALSRQSALPNEIVQAIVALLKDPDRYTREAAATALSNQSALPEEIVQAMVALLKDPDRYIRMAVSRVLGQQAALPEERFYYFLLKLDNQSFNNVYNDWLGRSFSDHLTWYIKGNNYRIYLPEGDRNIPFGQLQNAVQEARMSSKVPVLRQT